ncbi:sensor histidine kinase [Streptomyces sp. NPDC020412]|uniref:sensor histidine kinase n=1 Tax=Streptomyces sp. NPDC020412 TaxID=3365073 RepID=UPI0037A0D639
MKGWSGRTGLAKVNIYCRGTVYFVQWAMVVGYVLPTLVGPVREHRLALAGPVVGIALGLVIHRLSRRAMDAYLGRGTVSRPLLWSGVAVTAVALALALSLADAAHPPKTDIAVAYLIGLGLAPFLAAHSLLVPLRTTLAVQFAVLIGVGAALLAVGHTRHQLVGIMSFVGFLTLWMAFTACATTWTLKVMWELREARDVQARLAVAEERLRFGRDLHDVLGRNLAVVALKSELAVQLARRGRAEAVDQMVEVQRIAQDSQREVREVVRGYREADLSVELDGARSVLGAAGISCTVVADGVDRLSAEVRSALGWVVREATTNVLRHGDAQRCTISVKVPSGGGAGGDDAVVLVVENDRADAPTLRKDGGGSGLAGLRERLAAVGGELEAGAVRGGRFRVTVRVACAGGSGVPLPVDDGPSSGALPPSPPPTPEGRGGTPSASIAGGAESCAAGGADSAGSCSEREVGA